MSRFGVDLDHKKDWQVYRTKLKQQHYTIAKVEELEKHNRTPLRLS